MCCAPAGRLPPCLRSSATRARVGLRFGSLRSGQPTELAAAGVAAFLGHLFPVFHRFQGGKGVATAAGVLFALRLANRPRHRRHLGRDRGRSCATPRSLRWWPRCSRLSPRHSSSAGERDRGGRDGRAALLAPPGNIAQLLAGTEPRLGEKKRSALQIPARLHREPLAGDDACSSPQPQGARRTRSSRRCRCRTRARDRTPRSRARAAAASSAARSCAVGADAARDHEPREPGALERRERFRDQHVDDRRLRTPRAMSARRCVGARLSRAAVSTAVFSPLKLKSRSPLRDHRPRQADSARAAALGQLRERRPAGIAAARAASRSCRRPRPPRRPAFAEQRVAPDAGDAHELGVAARDEQRDERELGRRRGEQRREQVAFEVVDADAGMPSA